jgi:PAS domain S-box-containing protein
LLDDCRAVLDKLAPVERQVTSVTSGRVYMRRVQPYRTVDNRINGVVITFIEVTALHQAELKATETEGQLRVVIEGARDFAMFLMDTEGKIVTWNVGAERLLGWSPTEAVGQKAAMIYTGDDAEAQQFREMEKAAREGRAEDETWHRRKDGTRIWGSGVLTAIHNHGGKLTGFVKVLRDETARRDAETDRDQLLIHEQSARKDAEQAGFVKDQFLARLSHELRTPLSAILTWAEMLQHGSLGPDESREGLRVIERSAAAQANLLNDLLEVSRIASGKLRLEKSNTWLDSLVQLTVEAMAPMARDRGISLETDIREKNFSIYADPDRLRQVVSNLLTNALKFTPSGGRISLRVERVDRAAEIRVSDTGQGIDRNFLPHIFTPFSQADFSMTRAYGGLGLGLSISKELVELHGGMIEARSEGLGKGATLIVRLPAGEAAESIIEKAVRGAKILLVEDDPGTQAALVRMLTGYVADVKAVADAQTAFDSYQESRPDVIISDVGLPKEDGYQLLQRIRSLEEERGWEATPAIALSAFAGDKYRRDAREAGYHEHVAKPAKADTLLEAVARFLPEKR